MTELKLFRGEDRSEECFALMRGKSFVGVVRDENNQDILITNLINAVEAVYCMTKAIQEIVKHDSIDLDE